MSRGQKCLFIILICGWMTGCTSAYLQEPLCQGIHFPEEYNGYYRINLPELNVTQGNLQEPKGMIMHIAAEAGSKLRVYAEQSFAQKTGLQLSRQANGDISYQMVIKGIRMMGDSSLCKVGDKYVQQERQTNGRYMLQQMNFSPSGVFIGSIGFAVADLRAAGIAHDFILEAQSTQEGRVEASVPSLLIRNSGTSAEDVMRLARSYVYGVFLERVEAREARKILAQKVPWRVYTL